MEAGVREAGIGHRTVGRRNREGEKGEGSGAGRGRDERRFAAGYQPATGSDASAGFCISRRRRRIGTSMRAFTDQEKRTVRIASILIGAYLVIFAGWKGWSNLSAKRLEYQT